MLYFFMSIKKTPKNKSGKNHKYMNEELLLTTEGHSKLKAELSLLKGARRKEVIGRIEEALKLGDLKENAEYHDAKDEQGFVEGRILDLEALLARAKVVEKKSGGPVAVGSELVCYMNNKEKSFTIVGAEEADPIKGRISNSSPIAQALFGRQEGDTVQITTPAGVMSCKILRVK